MPVNTDEAVQESHDFMGNKGIKVQRETVCIQNEALWTHRALPAKEIASYTFRVQAPEGWAFGSQEEDGDETCRCSV